jgi:hypothetical protein
MNKKLQVKNNETTINALARSNEIIKSIFHFKKPITFLVVSLAIQKVRKISYSDSRVYITRDEVKNLTVGNDKKIGINIILDQIRYDIEKNSFFNLYSKKDGLKNVRTSLIDQTAFTDDIFESLYIDFKKSLFKKFKTSDDYSIQTIEQLKLCNNNDAIIILYTITQPYAKFSQKITFSITEIRTYLKIEKSKYLEPSQLTRYIKQLCERITKNNDIILEFDIVKKGRVTVGYTFKPKFKKQTKTRDIEEAIIVNNKDESFFDIVTQQLRSWKVSQKQINTWLRVYQLNQLAYAINLTKNRKKVGNSKSNPGGYLYTLIGDGSAKEKQAFDKEYVNYLTTDIIKLSSIQSRELVTLMPKTYVSFVLDFWEKNKEVKDVVVLQKNFNDAIVKFKQSASAFKDNHKKNHATAREILKEMV